MWFQIITLIAAPKKRKNKNSCFAGFVFRFYRICLLDSYASFGYNTCNSMTGRDGRTPENAAAKRRGDMKDAQHKKKMIAPILITVLFIVYLIAYGIGIGTAVEWSPLMILLAIPLAALGIDMVYILKARINEIRSGEEDDLGNY